MSQNKRIAKQLLRLAKQLVADWPTKVDKGGLRDAMGLDPDIPLEEQADPSDVAAFFEDADAEGRGMVMFAINSNQDNDFWQDVHDAIKE